MAAAAERPPLIGPWPGAWQVRRRRPGAREWAPRSLRCCGELEPGSSQRPAGRRRAAPWLPSGPKRAGNPSRALPALAKRTLCPARIVPTVGAALDVQARLGPRRLTTRRKRPLCRRRAPILGRA